MQLEIIENLATTSRLSANGHNLGQRIAFNSKGTPAEMREAYKAAGLKGNKLSAAVRDAVKGGKDIAWVSFQALIQQAQNGEFIPTMGDMNAKGTKIKLELEKPATVKPAKEKALPATPSDEQVQTAAVALIAAKMGISLEEAANILK